MCSQTDDEPDDGDESIDLNLGDMDQAADARTEELVAMGLGDMDQKAGPHVIDVLNTKTAKILAISFACMLGLLLLGHYAFLWFTINCACPESRQDMIEAASEYLHAWLPAVVGIVSATTSFYFAKRD